jgi:small subunit ribosomal protein S20
MAHHKSAKKRIRRNARRAVINGDRKSRVRTFIKNIESAIETGEKDAAETAFREAQPVIHRGAQRGALPRNTAARKLSRLSARIKTL